MNTSTNLFPLYIVPHYITRKKHPSHDNYLYRRWNNPTTHNKKTKKTRTKSLLVKRSTTKDDTSVTPTLSTLDTRSSHPTNIDTDTILNITIWNQPLVQYQVPIRPNTRHRSREHTSIAVKYALIDVYDKLLHPRKSPCLSYQFITRISCVVSSCFILLADSFTMVKH